MENPCAVRHSPQRSKVLRTAADGPQEHHHSVVWALSLATFHHVMQLLVLQKSWGQWPLTGPPGIGLPSSTVHPPHLQLQRDSGQFQSIEPCHGHWHPSQLGEYLVMQMRSSNGEQQQVLGNIGCQQHKQCISPFQLAPGCRPTTRVNCSSVFGNLVAHMH